MLVFGTREGLVGKRAASGWIIDTIVPFVALPSDAALRLWVWVLNPLTHQQIKALVLDVGPHNTSDTAYVFGGARPLAESGISYTTRFGIKYATKPANKAGIDLGEAVWKAIGMVDNSTVEWVFA